ncbi:hypothetical protein ACGFJ7_19895 [Actinoplanes sp. NPDC048988]|uniref:hypothetical protein n=1 Tax=Actinoplanes sp. NPDC048988 TaxID=3363901 RepID=UPI00371AFD08
MTEPEQPPATGGTRSLTGIALIAALVVLVGFGVFIWFLATQSRTTEVSWTRLAWLFASVEAIAFGAAGALFGSTIQRQRAEQAEAAAAANADAAARGRALSAAIQADAPSADARGGLEALGPGDDVAARHAALARALFP